MHIKYKKILIIILLLLITMTSTSIATESIFVWSNESEEVTTSSSVAEQTGNFLNLESASAVLMEQNTGKILYEHNPHEQLRPASVTKIMSLVLIMEAIDSGKLNYTDKIQCTERAAKMGGSQIWLDVREELSVDEMLKAICVVSANDCTVAMAEYISGSEELFVEQMNNKAKQLGMNDTTFKNCHGLDEEGHVTSSYDIALMSRELMINHPNITKYTTIWMDSLRDGQSELVNTNKLVRNYTGATGLKTGSTSVALFNLSATATRDNLSLISVIMRGPTSAIRFSEAQKLLDYGFSNYSYKEFGKQNEIVQNVVVAKGVEQCLALVLDKTAGTLIKKGQEKAIEQNIIIEENIQAPIIKGQKLGEVTFTLNGEIIDKVELVASKEVRKINIFNMTGHIYMNWFKMLRKI